MKYFAKYTFSRIVVPIPIDKSVIPVKVLYLKA